MVFKFNFLLFFVLLPIIYLNKNTNLFNFFNNLLKNKYIMLMIFSIPMIMIAGIFNPKDYSNLLTLHLFHFYH